MLDGIALWNRDHANFAVLLDLFERQLDLFHEGESPDYDLMSDIMFYMTHYTDLVHHPREDLAFARVREREPVVTAVVDELEAQHVVLKVSGEALIRALDDIVNGSITSRDQLETPGRKYLEAFRGHMAREEEVLLPLVTSLLKQRDWSAIDDEIRHVEDPVFGKNVDERYAALRAQIAREAHISASPALR